MPLVLLEDGPADGVRVLTLNDPDRRNALSPGLQAELGDAVETVAADPDARALVVAGNGPAFSAGADLPAVFGELHREVGEIRAGLHAIYDSFLRVRRLAIPTIAAVQGAAVGAGVNLAMCCDVRIAGPHARFGVTFTKLGLHPGGGCTWFLVQALGRPGAGPGHETRRRHRGGRRLRRDARLRGVGAGRVHAQPAARRGHRPVPPLTTASPILVRTARTLRRTCP